MVYQIPFLDTFLEQRMPRNYQPCSQFVKTSLVYRTLQSYKVCRVNTVWNVAGTVGGDAESLRDQR